MSVLLLSGCGDDGDGESSGSPSPGDTGGEEFDGMIKIGVNESVTGPAASNGAPWRDSAVLGVAQVNANGGIEIDGKRYGFELVERDNESDPERAIGIAQEFLRDGIKFSMGPGISTAFSPAFESLEGGDIAVFTGAGVAGPILGTDRGERLFVTIVKQDGEAGSVAASAQSAIERFEPQTAALLLPEDPVGELHATNFTRSLEEAGVDIVYSERFSPETVDFAPFITQMAAQEPDLVVTGYIDRWVEPIVAQAVEAGLTEPAFVGSAGTSQAPFEAHSEITRAMITTVTRAVDNLDDSSLDDFRAAYTEQFDKEPDQSSFWTLMYYDSIRMLARAMEEAGTFEDVDAIIAAMSSDEVTDYPVRGLDLSYDDQNQAHFTVQTRFIEDGETSFEDVELNE